MEFQNLQKKILRSHLSSWWGLRSKFEFLRKFKNINETSSEICNLKIERVGTCNMLMQYSFDLFSSIHVQFHVQCSIFMFLHYWTLNSGFLTGQNRTLNPPYITAIIQIIPATSHFSLVSRISPPEKNSRLEFWFFW